MFEQVDATLELLHTKYLKAQISYDGLQRVETFPFPLRALREAILNAVVHKDYSSAIPIQIKVYEHQIILWNPGDLPSTWTVESLLKNHPSKPPNPLIASAFFRAGYIEAWGRGVETMLRECLERKLAPPVFDTSLSGLTLTFRAATSFSSQPNFGENLTDTDRQIIKILRSHSKLSASKVAESIGVTSRAVEQSIAKLKALGILHREGPAKGSRWVVSLGSNVSGRPDIASAALSD